MALGINLHVGYMTCEGVTIDDAILLNDKLVTEDGLSLIFVHQEEYEIEKLDGKIESFGRSDFWEAKQRMDTDRTDCPMKDIMGLNPMNPVTINDVNNSLRGPRIFKEQSETR